MTNILIKIKTLLVEKRFLKAVKNKIYPYLKGFFLLFLSNSKKIKIFLPKKNSTPKKIYSCNLSENNILDSSKITCIVSYIHIICSNIIRAIIKIK